jgi:hypothetical protein
MGARNEDWRAISLRGRSLQPHTDRDWACQPAWDVDALYAEPDARVSLPKEFMWEEKEGKRRELRPVGVFWNRHVDPRFRVSYAKARRDAPRFLGRSLGEAGREWDVLVAERDRILREAGLGPGAATEAVARALADSFACDLFEKKPMCPTFPEKERALDQALEGLLYRSHCVGCAKAYEALADSLGFDVRTVGCGAHRVAEVRVGKGWRLVDSVARHRKNRGLDCFFKSSFHDSYLDPRGDHGDHLTPDFRRGLLRRANPQFHFHDGTWGGPRTLRWAASCARALYPDQERWGVKGEREVPILKRAGGFYWPIVHPSDLPALEAIRRETLPDAVPSRVSTRDYLFFEFRKGQALRESAWLGDLAGCRGLRVTLSFGWSRRADFGSATGSALSLRVNGVEKTLADWGAWPPRDRGKPLPEVGDPSGEMVTCEVHLPTSVLVPHAVNWISLIHAAPTPLWVPCAPAVLEPHLPPLGEVGAARELAPHPER